MRSLRINFPEIFVSDNILHGSCLRGPYNTFSCPRSFDPNFKLLLLLRETTLQCLWFQNIVVRHLLTNPSPLFMFNEWIRKAHPMPRYVKNHKISDFVVFVSHSTPRLAVSIPCCPPRLFCVIRNRFVVPWWGIYVFMSVCWLPSRPP